MLEESAENESNFDKWWSQVDILPSKLSQFRTFQYLQQSSYAIFMNPSLLSIYWIWIDLFEAHIVGRNTFLCRSSWHHLRIFSQKSTSQDYVVKLSLFNFSKRICLKIEFCQQYIHNNTFEQFLWPMCLIGNSSERVTIFGLCGYRFHASGSSWGSIGVCKGPAIGMWHRYAALLAVGDSPSLTRPTCICVFLYRSCMPNNLMQQSCNLPSVYLHPLILYSSKQTKWIF